MKGTLQPEEPQRGGLFVEKASKTMTKPRSGGLLRYLPCVLIELLHGSPDKRSFYYHSW